MTLLCYFNNNLFSSYTTDIEKSSVTETKDVTNLCGDTNVSDPYPLRLSLFFNARRGRTEIGEGFAGEDFNVILIIRKDVRGGKTEGDIYGGVVNSPWAVELPRWTAEGRSPRSCET